MKYDIILRGGTVIDGTGSGGFRADVGIIGERIAFIGDLGNADAVKIIDAKNKAVTPGFIDMHSHADCTVLAYPKTGSAVMQGVTTIVGGQCGISPAPLADIWFSTSYDVEPLREFQTDRFGFDDLFFELAKVKPSIEKYFNISLDYNTFGSFYEKVQRSGIACNFVPVVGHGQIRLAVMGMDFKRRATPDEEERIRRQIDEAMEWGAFGVSVGLDYEPGIYCDFDELQLVGRQVAKYNGIFFSHWRKTGLRIGTPKKQRAIDGLREALEVGLRTGAQVQISHIAPCYDVTPNYDPQMMAAAARRTLDVFDSYRERGVNARFDLIPARSGGIIAFYDLAFYLDQWVQQCGGSLAAFAGRLQDTAYRGEIVDYMREGKFFPFNYAANPEWDTRLVVLSHANSAYEKRTVKQIADANGTDGYEALMLITAEDVRARVDFDIRPDDIVREVFLNHPDATTGPDTFYFDLNPPFPARDDEAGMTASYGTYSSYIYYLNRYPLIPLERKILKASGAAARALGLSDRGTLECGKKADILVFDPLSLRDNQNGGNPAVYPTGMDFVLINGVAAVENGVPSGASSGRVLRRAKQG